MKLICSNCGAGFEVRPEALGPTGRKVRCSACGYQWTARAGAPAAAIEPPPAAAAAAPPEALAPTPPEADLPDAVREPPPEPDAEPEIAIPAYAAMHAAPELQPAPPPDDDVVAPPPQRAAPPPMREEVRPPRRWGAVIGWMLFAAVLTGLGAAVMMRETVMAAFPQARDVFRAFGFNVPQPATDLDIVDTRPTWSRNTADGQPTLVIEGRVKNLSNASRDIPELRAVLRNGTTEVQSWSFTAAASRVGAGAEVPFRTEARAPPAATTVVVVFATVE